MARWRWSAIAWPKVTRDGLIFGVCLAGLAREAASPTSPGAVAAWVAALVAVVPAIRLDEGRRRSDKSDNREREDR